MAANVRGVLEGACDLVMGHLPQILASRHDVTWKPDGSPVTRSDVFVEKLVRDYLIESLGDIYFVGEESYAGEVETDGLRAILDPIDGTENFCSGLKEWGLALTLWSGPDHLGSLLLMPELEERLMTGDTVVPIRSRIRGFSSSMCPEIIEGIASGGEQRIMGCSVYNMYNVVRGAYRRFSNPKGGYVWDVLAGLMLALEHGCEVVVEERPFDGQYLSPDQRYRFDIRHRHGIHPR